MRPCSEMISTRVIPYMRHLVNRPAAYLDQCRRRNQERLVLLLRENYSRKEAHRYVPYKYQTSRSNALIENDPYIPPETRCSTTTRKVRPCRHRENTCCVFSCTCSSSSSQSGTSSASAASSSRARCRSVQSQVPLRWPRG